MFELIAQIGVRLEEEVRFEFLALPQGVWGALGAGLALVLLKGGFEFFKQQLGEPGRFLGIEAGFGFFPDHVSFLMVLAGLVLGFLGSFVSLFGFGRVRA